MTEQPIIVVTGATGSQGGGLVRAIAADPSQQFRARALTRDPGSEAARDLAALGAEVVAADLDDPASLERAFEGVHGAYCVTFFWAHFSPAAELAHARSLAETCRRAGVEHVIWSTLEDTRRWVPLDDDRMPTLMDHYKVPHFDAKGEADAVFEELGVPTTYLLTSYYWDNLIGFGMGPVRDERGDLVLRLPMADAKLPGIAAEDIGRCALGIFARGNELVGQRIGIAGEHLSGDEMAAALGRALGEPVGYEAVPHDVYRGLGFPGAADLGNMFQFKCDFEEDFRAVRDVSRTRELYPGLLTFEQWLDRHGDDIEIEPR